LSAENREPNPAAVGTARDDDPRTDPLFRVAALAGALALPLAIIAAIIAEPTARADVNPGSTDAELLEVLIDTRTEQAWAAACWALAAVGLWIFLGPLWARVRRGSEWLALVAVVGGVVVGALLLLSSATSIVAWVAADYEDADTARFLVLSGWETARVAVAPALVMVGATTLAGVQYEVFGFRMNLFGVLFTFLLALGMFPASPAGVMGLAVTVWVLVAALTLAFTTPHPVRAPRARAAPA
jgi:hypothetical protein